jgi:hypothetical protein
VTSEVQPRRPDPGHARRRRALVAALVLAAATISVAADAAPARAGVSADARLPDLAVLPPSSLRIVVRDSGRKVLRFTSIIVNVGRGPLQLSGDAEDGFANRDEILGVRQQILEADGTFSSRDTGATMFWSGDGHDHWHVTGNQVASLENLDDPAADPFAAYRKTGFCFFDSYRYTSKKAPFYTAGRHVCQTRASGRVRMGVSVKWGDIYPAKIAYQWIDVTGLPNGKYRLNVIADPATVDLPGGNFVESDETNNRGWVKIRIQGRDVTILKRSPRP